MAGWSSRPTGSAAPIATPSVFGLSIGPDWSFVGSLFGLRERLEAYDRDAITFSALMERRFSERLSGNLGPVLDFGSIGPPGGTLTPYQIAGFQFGGRYDGTDSLLDPAKGYRVSGTLTPVLVLQRLRAPSRRCG